MIFDPMKPLSDAELDKLGKDDFDRFLEYLDSKAEYLKQYTKPLGRYHTKRFAALDAVHQGKEVTKELLSKAAELGKVGELETQQRIIDKMEELGLEEPDKKVKNVKTHRSQWFE